MDDSDEDQSNQPVDERPQREIKHTPKMASFMEEEAQKRLSHLNRTYDQWKTHIESCKRKLKGDQSEEELGKLIDSIKTHEQNILQCFDKLKYCCTPDMSVVRRVDACIAVSHDTVKLISEMISGLEHYDDQEFKAQLRKTGYANSIFTATESDVDAKSFKSGMSIKSAVSEKAFEAAVDLADKRAELAALEIERKYNDSDNKHSNHGLIEAKKGVAAAEARLDTYTQVANKSNNQFPDNDNKHSVARNNDFSTCELAKALADSVNLNRLPVPEPSIFNGDPLQFVEWRTSFRLLIEGKGITSDEKIFYLRKYVGGEAKRAIESFFFSGSAKGYDNAMDILKERFGHPFIIQRAFRTKLDNWSNIPARNPRLLRDYADFLRACEDASEHFSNLSVLDDCVENRKMVKKLPEWAAMKWNREVQSTLDYSGSYPTFRQFVNFVSKEARIACNPMSSPYLFESKYVHVDKHNVKTLSTNASESSESLSNDTTIVTCVFCSKKRHAIADCFKFNHLSIKEKRNFIRENRLCFGCLNKGHRNKDCNEKLTCNKCNLRHPTCMHEERTENIKVASAFHVNRNEGSSTSMIVPVWLSSDSTPDCEILTYALLDTQSDTSFIHDDTANSLLLQGDSVRLSLATMASERTIIQSKRITGLTVRGFQSSERLRINNAYTRSFIPADRSHIPTCETASMWPHLRAIADNIPCMQSCDVGLLLGYNCPEALVPRRTIQGEGTQPYAVLTSLGWSVVGYSDNTHNAKHNVSATCHRVCVKELPPLSPKDAIKALETDFAHDEVNDVKVSQEDIMFLNTMKENIRQRNDKHLELPLPFKKRPVLPSNRDLALRRLSHLKRKLSRDEQYHERYKTFMKEMIERGDAERVPEKSASDSTWYIPHHGVCHTKKPGKLRIVFDCSAKCQNTSLNEHLLNGPDLTNGLVGVLIRFRRFPVAIMCDIEKMFLQFFVCESDRDYLRFLWWKDGDINSEIIDLRMRKHLFGATSSPACANYGLKHIAKRQETEYPQAASFVQHDFYVDDGLASVKTEQEAVQLVKDARAICSNGGLRLHKFVSNSRNVIESVPASERAENVKDLDMSFQSLPVERALGITWSIEQDAFQFNVFKDSTKYFTNMPPSRRNILSVVASIFDPLGFLSPVTLKGKKILQKMCQSGIGWDEQLADSDKPEWNNWIKDLRGLQNLPIKRCFIPNEVNENTIIELHHFSDASSYGYGQCSYIRLVYKDSVHCAFIFGKARVAPLNIVTIPRLELAAALLSVKVSQFLKREIDLPVNREYFWTDSRVVLGYIANEARRFHVFVANRVQTITQSTEPCQWFYVQSSSNPADHASRGLNVADLENSTWFTGPDFLWRQHIESDTVIPELQLGDPEVRSARVLCTETTQHASILELIERFSCWSKTISVVARLQRLANGVKGTYPPTVEERCKADLTIVRLLQTDSFPGVEQVLVSNSVLPKSNSLHMLNPILENGVLRVGTRLRNVNLPDTCIYPAILPKNGHVTRLIISHAHQNIKHQGRGFTVNELRCLGYWVVGGSKAVANFIKGCVVCRKLRRPTECQKMADLPKDRVEPSPPFTYCGMDCFGPFIIKQGRKELKRYGLLFTCLCSRAIHIKMLDDMSTDAFINGLRCFMAIRGPVRHIRSDQGSNFIGARNEFEKGMKSTNVNEFLLKKQCDFVLNAPSSSHTGGVWERQIRTVRNILNAILSQNPGRLDDSSLRTVFYEIMTIVNNRPLTVSDINDPMAEEPLTPNHILTAKRGIAPPPPGEFVQEDLYARKRWRRVQYLLEQFWSRWKREYVANLALRDKWRTPQRNICVGDIVLVKDQDLSRNQWPLAKVVEAKSDADGLVRRVKVLLKNKLSENQSILERSIHKLVLLVEISVCLSV